MPHKQSCQTSSRARNATGITPPKHVQACLADEEQATMSDGSSDSGSDISSDSAADESGELSSDAQTSVDSDDDCDTHDTSTSNEADNNLEDDVPSIPLRRRNTTKSVLQPKETTNLPLLRNVPACPMIELQAGTNVWYQAYVMKESLNEVKIRCPSTKPKQKETVEWVSKTSSRLWRGSLSQGAWKYVGQGAWVPKKPLSVKVVHQSCQDDSTRSRPKRSSTIDTSCTPATTHSSQHTAPHMDEEVLSPRPRASPAHVKLENHTPCTSAHTPHAREAPAIKQEPEETKPCMQQPDCTHQMLQGPQGSFSADTAAAAGPISGRSSDDGADVAVSTTKLSGDDLQLLNDPLTEWFKVHLEMLGSAGKLSMSTLPTPTCECGHLPPGFVWDACGGCLSTHPPSASASTAPAASCTHTPTTPPTDASVLSEALPTGEVHACSSSGGATLDCCNAIGERGASMQGRQCVGDAHQSDDDSTFLSRAEPGDGASGEEKAQCPGLAANAQTDGLFIHVARKSKNKRLSCILSDDDDDDMDACRKAKASTASRSARPRISSDSAATSYTEVAIPSQVPTKEAHTTAAKHTQRVKAVLTSTDIFGSDSGLRSKQPLTSKRHK